MHLSYTLQVTVSMMVYINYADFLLHYFMVYDAINLIIRIGHGTQMAKIDIKSAFRLCPVHPTDNHLLGVKWKGQFYFDCVLPFDLRSAPFIFNCLAGALEWIAIQKGSVQSTTTWMTSFSWVPPGMRCTLCHHSAPGYLATNIPSLTALPLRLAAGAKTLLTSYPVLPHSRHLASYRAIYPL